MLPTSRLIGNSVRLSATQYLVTHDDNGSRPKQLCSGIRRVWLRCSKKE